MTSPEQINAIQRPVEIPEAGLISDLVWSDPEESIAGWGSNTRGISYVFGKDVVADFLQTNRLDLVCRAHQVVEDGYEFFANRQLVTIFSAPNYCGEFDNSGGIMQVDKDLVCSFAILRPRAASRMSSPAPAPRPTPWSFFSHKASAKANAKVRSG